MDSKQKERVAAAIALIIIVLLLVLAGIVIRPSEPTYMPTVTPDTISVANKAPKVKKEAKKQKTKRKPHQRDFLNEPVPSE